MRDLGPAARTAAEEERLVEADVNLAGGAKRRDVAQQLRRHLQSARMQRTDLTAFERAALGITQFVQIPPMRHFDQVLGVTEQADDRHDADAGGRRGSHQSREFVVGICVIPGDVRQTGVLDRILEVKVEFLVTPFGVARQPVE